VAAANSTSHTISVRQGAALALAVVAAIILALLTFSGAAQAARAKLTLQGATLKWAAVPGAKSYQVRVEVGKEKTYVATSATTYTINLTPELTTKYRVRTLTPESGGWSEQVKLGGTLKSGKKGGEESEEAPKTEEPPRETGPIVFSPGINAGYDRNYDLPGASQLGAHLVRLDVEFTEDEAPSVAETIAAYVARGITPQPLFDFNSRMPSKAQARSIVALAKLPGVKLIEFGNETAQGYQYGNDGPADASYKQRARTYAERFVEAAQALAPYHVGLLAQGSPEGTGSPVWVNEMFAAEPELTKYVAGWTTHPYGTNGAKEMEETIAGLNAHHAGSLPIDVTEWGLASDNGRALSDNYGFPVNLTYAEAATLLRQQVARFKAICAGRLRSFILYQVRDQQPTGVSTNREFYFGALQHLDQSKGAYTEAVKALFKE
jgi:hypothetical protein